MKILISGASGLLGTHLIPILEAKGHEIHTLVRKTPKGANEIRWDSKTGFADEDQKKLEGFDAVIHLAGDNIASENWSPEKKRKIRESRSTGTRVLVEALRKTENPPRIFLSASATGFYGDRGDEDLTEASTKGEGFLPDVCDEWEQEARKAADFGARVALLRTGVVLTKEGGALEKMLTPFKFGVGGTVGSGKQYMSWISLDDTLAIYQLALENGQISGAVNTTAPNPVTNAEFTDTLGKVLHRPTVLPVPEFAIRLLFGEMGERLLLEGNKVLPKKLQDFGFEFKFPDLEEALREAVN